ncbi:MAG: hypothetical protein AAGC55_08190 [Myxococcota bacterium]
MIAPRGFQFDETMAGHYELLDRPDQSRPLSFTIKAHAPSMTTYLRDRRLALSGTLEAVGFADYVPVEGTMVLDPLVRGVIAYELQFTGNDGQPYLFSGQKDITPRRLVRSLTELPGHICDATGATVARCHTRFDLRADWLQFVASWRLTR